MAKFIIGMEGGSEDGPVTFGAAVIVEGQGSIYHAVHNPVTKMTCNFKGSAETHDYLAGLVANSAISFINADILLCIKESMSCGILVRPKWADKPLYLLRVAFGAQILDKGPKFPYLPNPTYRSETGYRFYVFESFEKLQEWAEPIAKKLREQAKELMKEATILWP